MMLKMKAFDVPTRPPRIELWSPRQVLLHIIAVSVFGYLTGTWLSLVLIGYVLIIETVFFLREWRWNRYADRCEGTFVEIGEAAEALGAQIQRIAVEVEARAAQPAAPETVPLSGESSSTGPVRFWTASSKGQN